MRLPITALCYGALICCGLHWGGTARAADSLESVLARVDRSSTGFKGLTVDVQKVSFTAVINQSAVDEGSMVVKRPKPHDLRMLVDIKKTDQKTLAN
jgi:hypothetical protein